MGAALLILFCLFVIALVGASVPGLVSLFLVVAVDVAWLLANGPMEGKVLLVLAEGRGLTVADLAVLLTVPAAWLSLMSVASR